MRERIDEVCSFETGWLDGHGEAITSNPDQVELVAQTMADKLGMLPGIFPTIDGRVSLEWMLDRGDEFEHLEIII